MALEPHRSRIGFLRRLLAQDCILCAAPSGDSLFCAGCARDLPALGDACPRCAGPSPGGAVCDRCLSDPPSFDATVAVWPYGFPIVDDVMTTGASLEELARTLKQAGAARVENWVVARAWLR